MLGSIFVINVLLSRQYDLTALGTFNFCYAISQIGVLGLGSGFSLILRRELTIAPEKFNTYIQVVLKLRFLLLAGILLLLLPFLFGLPLFQDNILLYLTLLIISKGFDSFSETFVLFCALVKPQNSRPAKVNFKLIFMLFSFV